MSTTVSLSNRIEDLGRLRHPRWLTVLSHTDPRYGGLSSAVPRLSEAIGSAAHFDMAMAAFCAPGEHVRPEGLREQQLSFWPVSHGPWLKSAALRQQFAAQVREVDGLHIHGLWEASTAMASRTARRLGRPYLLSAHGMLEPWALANKRLKKQIYAGLVERKAVTNAACLHALTEAEAQQYRDFGAQGPVAIIPNAVQVPVELSAEPFFASFPGLRAKRIVLFLGRLHPKKGLDLLASAWGSIARSYPAAHLVLAGPDTLGTAAKLDHVFTAQGCENTVTFTGMLDEESKWSALAAAELFVLPSYSEGLSMGTLEALGAGVPVIVTRHCHMPDVTRQELGWEIEADVEALTAALNNALQSTPAQNKETGLRGSEWITKRYHPQYVATAMAEVYRYVLDGVPPTHVELH